MKLALRKELAGIAGLAALGLMSQRQKGWGLALGLLAGAVRFMPTPVKSVRKQSVVITGGSRGLGLALAKRFIKEKAQVTLLARDAAELERAEAILQEYCHHCEILPIPCDVTNRTELEQAFEQIKERFGGVDILVNNAGTIAVGPFETMQHEDFEALIQLQLHSVIHATQLALSSFLTRGEGRIVNICSIGGALPVPHMSTYCSGKFALAGFSESVGIELARHNIHVTTVYPGLMRTGSPKQAVFKGDHEKEYAWFQAGDVMPFISVSADEAAKHIVEGVKHGDAQVVFPMTTRLGILGYQLCPETYTFVMRQVARFFPQGMSQERKTGAESKQWLDGQLWYQPLRQIEEKAEATWNQEEKEDADASLGV